MRYLALFTLCLLGISSYAQGLIVGTVVHDQTDRSMAGAKVSIPSRSLETTTSRRVSRLCENDTINYRRKRRNFDH